jgi:hypothetical protein
MAGPTSATVACAKTYPGGAAYEAVATGYANQPQNNKDKESAFVLKARSKVDMPTGGVGGAMGGSGSSASATWADNLTMNSLVPVNSIVVEQKLHYTMEKRSSPSLSFITNSLAASWELRTGNAGPIQLGPCFAALYDTGPAQDSYSKQELRLTLSATCTFTTPVAYMNNLLYTASLTAMSGTGLAAWNAIGDFGEVAADNTFELANLRFFSAAGEDISNLVALTADSGTILPVGANDVSAVPEPATVLFVGAGLAMARGRVVLRRGR